MCIFLFESSNPTSTNDTTRLGLPCTSLFGGPVSPSIAFGGYDGKNYADASTLVVTFVINNHDDDSKNARAKAWEKRFIDYLKNFEDDHLEVAFMAERSIEDELERESHADIYTIVVSYLIMFLYITIALGQINQCDRFMVSAVNVNKGAPDISSIEPDSGKIISGIELCTGAGVPEPELPYILLEPEPEYSSKNSGRQNYEKLILMQIAVLPEFLRSVTEFRKFRIAYFACAFLMQKSTDPDVFFLLDMNDKGVTRFSY